MFCYSVASYVIYCPIQLNSIHHKFYNCCSNFAFWADTLKTAMPETGIPTLNEEDQTNLENQLPDMEIFNTPVITNGRQLQAALSD